MDKICNIVFDMGRVLVFYEPKAYLSRTFSDAATQDAVYDAVFGSKWWVEMDKGMSCTEALAHMIESAPHYESEINLAFHGWHKELEEIPDMRELILELKAAGKKLYILSNAGMQHWEYNHKIPCFDEFDGTLFSADVKLIKPDVKIYELLAKRYNLVASQTVFFDDIAENIKGALRAGWHAMQFTTVQKCREDLAKMGI